MKRILILLLLIPALLSAKTLTGKIVKVTDGDTVVLLDSANTQHKIRLDGIDCPERGQPYGTKATDFVKNIAAGKRANVEWEKKDRYGRILGVLIVDNVNVNKELLRSGLAWHYKHFNTDKELAELEQTAKDKKLNIWSDKNPIEPYRWRKGDR